MACLDVKQILHIGCFRDATFWVHATLRVLPASLLLCVTSAGPSDTLHCRSLMSGI